MFLKSFEKWSCLLLAPRSSISKLQVLPTLLFIIPDGENNDNNENNDGDNGDDEDGDDNVSDDSGSSWTSLSSGNQSSLLGELFLEL